jgi:hypothetical protein
MRTRGAKRKSHHSNNGALYFRVRCWFLPSRLLAVNSLNLLKNKRMMIDSARPRARVLTAGTGPGEGCCHLLVLHLMEQK